MFVNDLFQQGIELMRDDEGNVMIRNLSENAIIAKDYINPGMSCIGQELKENFGQVPKWFVKVNIASR